jgi:hypothetical protein
MATYQLETFRLGVRARSKKFGWAAHSSLFQPDSFDWLFDELREHIRSALVQTVGYLLVFALVEKLFDTSARFATQNSQNLLCEIQPQSEESAPHLAVPQRSGP